MEDVLLQYGPLGVIAIVSFYAIKKLFDRLQAQHERDVNRANKAEEQLVELNKVIREQLVVQLTRATDVMGKVAELLSDRRSRERP